MSQAWTRIVLDKVEKGSEELVNWYWNVKFIDLLSWVHQQDTKEQANDLQIHSTGNGYLKTSRSSQIWHQLIFVKRGKKSKLDKTIEMYLLEFTYEFHALVMNYYFHCISFIAAKGEFIIWINSSKHDILASHNHA